MSLRDCAILFFGGFARSRVTEQDDKWNRTTPEKHDGLQLLHETWQHGLCRNPSQIQIPENDNNHQHHCLYELEILLLQSPNKQYDLSFKIIFVFTSTVAPPFNGPCLGCTSIRRKGCRCRDTRKRLWNLSVRHSELHISDLLHDMWLPSRENSCPKRQL